MEQVITIKTPLTGDVCKSLHAGDRVFLTGAVYSARDTAHHRMMEAIREGNPLPFPLQGETIFYAGPTPARPGMPIGAIGPTTSSRMDPYTPELLERGLKGMIGKGMRSSAVREAINRYCGVYFGAVGGIAALLTQCVQAATWVAYQDLGPEGIMRLQVLNFPLIVINDCHGGDLYRDRRLPDEAMANNERRLL
ncbi:MAG: FumA C-terminus/TtdB family hydratase beta subunit [Syntrophobacterales bacterium]|jgi:fumarate hydratase subunit beta|nr:FumA C-terminus/TtdB family hydratase beta subunit [Syntrophobacterales bacterium]